MQHDYNKQQAVFGGKNPHPNFVVGGAPTAFSGGPGGSGQTTMNDLGLNIVRDAIIQMQEFVDQVYVPDTLEIARFYKDWFERGEGVGNFMTCGDFPAEGHGDPSSYLIPSGVILDRDLSKIHALDLNDPEQIQEFISRSWYDYEGGKDVGLHPYDGETKLNYTGPKAPYKFLDVEKDYSWLKSPRWRGRPMEVGPLARILMLYASRHEPTRELATMALSKLDLPLTAMFSTMGRTAARTLETKIIADNMMTWYNNLMANLTAGDLRTFNEDLWHPKTWPKHAKGVGYMEAPRGALTHYTVIDDGKLSNYQAVVPSTWNAGPRDPQGQPGPYEAALMDNHQMHDVDEPLEILRTIHSFDPCLACAVHMVGPDGKKGVTVKIT